MLPQHDQAEALEEALHPQAVGQEQQHHAGPRQAVDVDDRALLGEEALGQGVAVHRHRRLRHTESPNNYYNMEEIKENIWIPEQLLNISHYDFAICTKNRFWEALILPGVKDAGPKRCKIRGFVQM